MGFLNKSAGIDTKYFGDPVKTGNHGAPKKVLKWHIAPKDMQIPIYNSLLRKRAVKSSALHLFYWADP